MGYDRYGIGAERGSPMFGLFVPVFFFVDVVLCLSVVFRAC